MKRAFFILTMLILLTITSCHVGRFVIYNFANQSDHKKFQNTQIQNSITQFEFYRRDSLLNIKPIVGEKSFEEFLDDSKSVGFLIIQNDTLLYEWYDKNYDESSIVTTFSMAKSIVGLLIGIAIDEGFIKSENDLITDYLPELDAEGFDKIRVIHLLNMCSGIGFNESYINPFGHVAKFYYGRKLDQYVSKLKVETEPGTTFKYQSCDTQILSMILEKATGRRPAEYLQEKIWQRIGMQYDASWSIDSRKHNTEKAFCCLNARTIDLAKFGRLMLNNGNWNGDQIVSEEWINKSTQGSDIYIGYSRQWWILNTSDNDYIAEGILGQYLYINPAKKLIIVRMGRSYGDVRWKTVFREIAKSVSESL